MTRPEHLPDFANPPLDEVVLGVQFEPVQGYTSIMASEVWALYREFYPLVSEQPLLQPQFETFGGALPQATFQFQFGSQMGNRFWFVSDDENHLLQFQSDRFLLNWRKNATQAAYPRYEQISKSFRDNLSSLSHYFRSHFGHELVINQAEVSYINVIQVPDFSDANKWFDSWVNERLRIETLATNFTEVINDGDGLPCARMHHLIQSAFALDGKTKAYRLDLTFRGRPSGSGIEPIMEFLAKGREAIVLRFSELTTKTAHEKWGRKW